ncbi:MAG: purine-nucleoside phosphorylase [Alphaproteobacteria bacterium]|nr:purine-nucleoside phosphorylase [Alphaproteobacteria bacterium]
MIQKIEPDISPYEAVDTIKKLALNFVPDIGIILGSGLSSISDLITPAQTISYNEIPGFPKLTVPGHVGQMILGTWGHHNVVCLKGRSHLYEGWGVIYIQHIIRTLKLLGCKIVVLTNAAGAINLAMPAPNLMIINDHINFLGINPLIGPNDENMGVRFPDMTEVYNEQLITFVKQIAEEKNITLFEGVYLACTGPSFETPAEIRAFRHWGADAVGMSTVPEAILARHCGMKVIGISTLTNFAAGIKKDIISHEDTLIHANKLSHNLGVLLDNFFKSYKGILE